MTPRERVITFERNQRINQTFIDTVAESDFSRYPIYTGNEDNIVGILFAKDLIHEEQDISLVETEEAFDERFLKVRPDEKLDVVLGRMLKQKKHMGIVQSKGGQFLGVVTLEDIIEEIIQFEIKDEGDE